MRPDVATEPPPTFPFLESQCQRAVSDVNFHHAREATPPARHCPAGGVGAVYRRGLPACQTGIARYLHFFARIASRPAGSTNASFSGSTYMGRIPNISIECGGESAEYVMSPCV